MDFTTKVPVTTYPYPIDYASSVLLLGSCFAENIGGKFDYFQFDVATNPFGIIFNPVSIEKIVERAVNQLPFTEADIFCRNDLWHCYEVHSELSRDDKEVFLANLNSMLADFHRQISRASHCIITYGTAWAYRLLVSGNIVANCHKVPQQEFAKEILSAETIGQSIQRTLALIHSLNPDCRFIITVSPVRHLKDGFAENQRSKAHLITAIHKHLAEIDNRQPATVSYFPSYEIMMDELRDYRFYAEDMVHPNQTAIEYIWARFAESAIDPRCHDTMQEVATIRKSLSHRPFNPHTASHQKFLTVLNERIARLQQQFPHFRF